jgi:hypothetical protein
VCVPHIRFFSAQTDEVDAVAYAAWIRDTYHKLTKPAAEAAPTQRVWRADTEMLAELVGTCMRAGSASRTAINRQFKAWQAVHSKFFRREFGIDYAEWERRYTSQARLEL